MSEIISKENFGAGKKPKQAFATRKNPLSVINGDINTKERCTKKLKQSGKILMQDKRGTYAFLAESQKFKIFEDVDQENNNYSAPISHEKLSPPVSPALSSPALSSPTLSSPALSSLALSSSAISLPSCFGLSPEIQKDSLISKKGKNIDPHLIWCTPYRQDIHNYFKEIEQKFRPNPNYMDKQQDVNMGMRRIVIDWCVEVVEEYKMHAETLHLAVSYIDRFLSCVSIVKTKFQLIGATSMFIAAKYEEIHPPELKEFVEITDNTYTKHQVLRMEHLMLKMLNCDLSAPTAYTFLQLYLSACNAPDIVIHFSEYLCEMSLLYGSIFLKYPPSIIAAGSLALANYVVGVDIWNDTMESLSGYKLTDLHNICKCFYYSLNQMPSCPQKAIFEKYRSEKHGCASTFPFPDKLYFPISVEECLVD